MAEFKQLLSDTLRPRSIADLGLLNPKVQALSKMVVRESMLNCIFYGSPGIGKTSTARILIEAIGADTLEINGSLGINRKRMINEIEAFGSGVSLFDAPKICLIDEADYLPLPVQGALRNLIERKACRARFILTANDVSRLSEALQSRCMPICFDVLPCDAEKVIVERVDWYHKRLGELGYQMDEQRIANILRFYFPDFRAVANRFQLELG